MDNYAIRLEQLGKQYQIGAHQERYRTLREQLVKAAAAPFNQLRGKPASGAETIWALKDVSFDVQHGEVVGIIGRNGAGKSTLLKILSHITDPTEGRVRLRGRVGSLLEVGTGFHPELTGRENIYLNGAILGMRRAEIERKFDEIVDFSEIEKFLDTPVKRYSSGMYVRLAFAVAASLEPEILVVDEVLAVGDAAFQKKCLGKMGDVARQGRTVLFVSHNMTAIRNLCQRAIWLQSGMVYKTGETVLITEDYLRQNNLARTMDDVDRSIKSLPSDPSFRLVSIIIQQNGTDGNLVLNGQPIEVKVRYQVLQPTTGLRVYFDLLDDDLNILIRTFHDDDAEAIPIMEPGEYISIAEIPANLLAPRHYRLRVRGTVYNVRSCTGEGVDVPIYVEASSGISRAYVQDPVRAKLQPHISWVTRKIDEKVHS